MPSAWSVFQELKAFWKLAELELAFCHGCWCSPWTVFLGLSKRVEAGRQEFLCQYSETVNIRQLPSGTHMPQSPYADTSSLSGVSRYGCLTPALEVTAPAASLNRHRVIPVSQPVQHIFLCLSICLLSVRLKLNCEMEQLMQERICRARCRGSNLW